MKPLLLPALAATLALVAAGGIVGSSVRADAAPAVPHSQTGGGITHQQNPRVPDGASWTQAYFPSADDSGTELHADVLLPEGLADDHQVTPLVSIGPYFGHIGALDNDEGHTQAGPSGRFEGLILEGKALERGYAVVLVDGRGFGGSTGCQDAGGPGERADVTAAVEWAASQPWSTGKVGMYGKSYDAITGLIGNNLGLEQLGAVVAQEPIWDLERNFRSGGLPRSTSVSVGGLYSAASRLQGMPDDDPRYQENAAAGLSIDSFLCNLSYEDDLRGTDSTYWADRDFAELAKGSDTPVFFTQGTLEWNTEAEGMDEFLAHHQGVERGWIGPWDHVRGDQIDPTTGGLSMGRAGWYDEVFAFYDEHLRDAAPASDAATPDTPTFLVQDSTGTWRQETEWPADDRDQTIALSDGSYLDDGAARNDGERGGKSNTFLRWSKPVGEPTRLTGTPQLSFRTKDYGNVKVRLYDVAPDGTAIWFDEQASTVRAGTTKLQLRSVDWTLAEGHQLAVEIGTVHPAQGSPHMSNDWLDTPGGERIDISRVRLTLLLDDPADDLATQGDPAAYLAQYIEGVKFKLSPGKGTFALRASKG